jgi:hypothetical protein
LEDQIDAARHQERLIAWLSTFFGGLALLLAAIRVVRHCLVRGGAGDGQRSGYAWHSVRGAQMSCDLRFVKRFSQRRPASASGSPEPRHSPATSKGCSLVSRRSDAVTFVASPVVLALVALVACFLPARRASTIDPMVALRCE